MMMTNEHGGIVVDGRQVDSTLQCCHCNAHRSRELMGGFCRNCMGPTCKAQACMKCAPWEKQMEVIEQAARVKRHYDQFTVS
jgi:hypothetical protein